MDPASTRAGASAGPACSIGPPTREAVTRLIVDVGDHAGAWRDAATDVQRAYADWQVASAEQRGHAATVYAAAIDREEQAAIEYCRSWRVCCATRPEFQAGRAAWERIALAVDS